MLIAKLILPGQTSKPLALNENYYYFSTSVIEIKCFVKFCSTVHYVLLATMKSGSSSCEAFYFPTDLYLFVSD